jgi:nucleotide-binding universal stress UspA family protein
MFEKIVLAFDGSAQSEAAFLVALEVAQRFGSALLVVSVVRVAEPGTRVELEAVVEAGQGHFAEEHRRLALLARERGVSFAAEVDVGHPAEHVMRAAEAVGAGLIVVGRRGRNTFERLLLGSVSERILRFAHCPVLVVH